MQVPRQGYSGLPCLPRVGGIRACACACASMYARVYRPSMCALAMGVGWMSRPLTRFACTCPPHPCFPSRPLPCPSSLLELKGPVFITQLFGLTDAMCALLRVRCVGWNLAGLALFVCGYHLSTHLSVTPEYACMSVYACACTHIDTAYVCEYMYAPFLTYVKYRT